ncbi:MAG: MFS transporter [Ignavibacteriales bacterium]|nr:MAG: MFS transporter [Ignavibacteriales bacterium]
MSSIVPFLPLFVRELGITKLNETTFWSGLVFSGPFLVSFFLVPVWGVLGDKYGRKIMILRAIIGLAIAQFLIGFSQDVTQLFIARMIQGLLSGFLPAAMALIAASTPGDKMGYSLGILQSASAAGSVVGPIIGGVISDFLGFRNVFFVVSGLFLVTGIAIVIFIKENREEKVTESYTLFQNWKYVITKKEILVPSLLIMLATMGFAFVRPLFVLFIETIEKDIALLPTITGMLYSIIGIFSTVSAAYWGRKVERGGIKKNLLIASSLTAAMYLLHTVVSSAYQLIPIYILLGFGFGAIQPLLFTAIDSYTSKERKGGILGVATSFQILGNIIGPIAAGIIAGFAGLRFSFIITFVLFLTVAVSGFFSLKK